MMDINCCIDLIGGIIKQAIEDITEQNVDIKESAKRFLCSQKFEEYCSLIDINPNIILRKMGLTKSDILPENKNVGTNKISQVQYKLQKEMTPEELKEYRAAYRRSYNAKQRLKQFQLTSLL